MWEILKALFIYDAFKGFFGGVGGFLKGLGGFACCLGIILFPIVIDLLALWGLVLALRGWGSLAVSMVEKPSLGYGLSLIIAIASIFGIVFGAVAASQATGEDPPAEAWLVILGALYLYFGGIGLHVHQQKEEGAGG